MFPQPTPESGFLADKGLLECFQWKVREFSVEGEAPLLRSGRITARKCHLALHGQDDPSGQNDLILNKIEV